MISYEEFENIVVNILKRDISSNEEQKEAINSKPNESLFIVAGPGSGKTTVMVLKILKFIFVDDIQPTEILTTTFTRKAANELYSRVLSWGDQIKKYLSEQTKDFDKFTLINSIDFNQITIGTIDSIAEEIIRIHREPGTNLPVVIENFVSNSAMIHTGLYKEDRYLNEDLKKYLGQYIGKEKVTSLSQMSELLLEIKNALFFNQIDFYEVYNAEKTEGGKLALEIIKDYVNDLKSRNVIDFQMLEYKFLKKLNNSNLNEFLNKIKIILVDEYQDTNLIQEKIYFSIAKSAIKNNGSLTVVGDDDQSLYRFRGATVDLFTEFKKRAKLKLDIDIKEINLRTNYRSTKNIINHCNHFVELDKDYQKARVKRKPKIIASEIEKEKMPVIGMFRNSQEILAKDLSNFLKKLIYNKEVEIKVNRVLNNEFNTSYNKIKNNEANLIEERAKQINNAKNIDKITLKLNENGSPSDIAFLTFSPKEEQKGNRTLNFYLRNALSRGKKPLKVFNPRGKTLEEIDTVKIFCGLILECIDPQSKIQESMKKIPKNANRRMKKWRVHAREFIKTYPEPNDFISLNEFVKSWQERRPIGLKEWPENAPLMELAYKLITWVEELQDDIEGVVYLEAITKTITQTGFFNKYSANIVKGENEEESIKEAFWNIFIPIASGGVKIDENLLETLPEDRLNIMSIHQSKGLEFPLVIVDVASKFKKNRINTQKLRFPKNQEITDIGEEFRVFSELGKSERENKDKLFDDLTRLYFVAFSRAENVLMLVGVNNAIDGYIHNNQHQDIPNIALGWTRSEEFIGFDEVYLI